MKAGKFILAIIAVLAVAVGAQAGSYSFYDDRYFARDYEYGCAYGYACDNFGSDYVQFVAGVREKVPDGYYMSSPFNQKIVGGTSLANIYYTSPFVFPSYYGFLKNDIRPFKKIDTGKGKQTFGSRSITGSTIVASPSRKKRVVSAVGDSNNAIRETTDGQGRRVYNIFN